MLPFRTIDNHETMQRNGQCSKLAANTSNFAHILTLLNLLLPVFQILILFGSYNIFFSLAEAAGGDCMSGHKIDCFECNSWDDVRCHDPFNYTLHKRDMPAIRECEGCCVKMVQFMGTEHYQIRRTCTEDIDVNFFMVNHVCMTEGHRQGKMCFCEEDQCNAAEGTRTRRTKLGLSSAIMLLMLVWL